MKKNKKNMLVIAVGSVALIGLGVYLAYSQLYNHSKSSNKVNYSTTKPVIEDEESVTGRNRDKYDNITSNKMQTNALSVPILSKSSGNNGPIPRGVVVEFICLNKIGIECDIELTNKSTSNVIKLGKKKIAEGQGGSGAVWTWTSVAGVWDVVAISYDNNSSKESAKQELKVQ